MLISAWNRVSETIIVNSFKNTKISDKGQFIELNDEEDLFKELKNDPKEWQDKYQNLVTRNLTAKIFESAEMQLQKTSLPYIDKEGLGEAMMSEFTRNDVFNEKL